MTFFVTVYLAPNLITGLLPELSWRQLPPLPDPYGFASPFVGVDGNTLLLAGGANFSHKQMWEGGEKTWHDVIFALKAGTSRWEIVGKLPTPLAYGVSISTKNGVLCAGGSDAEKHYSTVYLLQWRNNVLTFQDLPPLPRPVAMGGGALVGSVVYLAGGLETPQSKEALTSFFALDLKDAQAGWHSLSSWPGRGRVQAVAASAAGYFYLFSGKADGRPDAVYFVDAYRYSQRTGWERLPDLRYPAVAAASPAPTEGDVVFLIGGADGTTAGLRPQEFRLSPQRIQAYSAGKNVWTGIGNAPVGRVCVSSVNWQGEWILPSGERSAGIRSPEVWGARILKSRNG
jgi:N-acetylneuraminic acid mutarotase